MTCFRKLESLLSEKEVENKKLREGIDQYLTTDVSHEILYDLIKK